MRLIVVVSVCIVIVGFGSNVSAQSKPATLVQATLYASPTGSGTVCSLKVPCSLSRARDKVRTINHHMTGNIVVVLRGGTYQLNSPFALDPKDSGSGGYNVIYQAYLDETPILSGGRTVTGWSLADGNKNIWQAEVGTALQTRQLYVNGVRARRARSIGGLSGGTVRTATGYTMTDTSLQNWDNPSDIEFVYQIDWVEMRCDVASIANGVVTMQEPCFSNSAGKHPGNTSVDLPTYVENAYELLNDSGDWYLNRTSGVLYYIPRTGEDLATANVVAPVLETLVSGTGTPDNPIHNIEFSGITFAYATWLRPSSGEGFSEVQANLTLTGRDWDTALPYGNWTKTPANITFSAAHDLRFERNIFTHLGGVGLTLEKGSQNNVIEGNVFTDISANGIQLGDVDALNPPANQQTTDNQIVNNYIHDLPVEYHGGVGIWTGYVANTLIAHNELTNLPYSGISNGWGWCTNASYAANNLIANNLIFNHMQLLSDGGGIYSNNIQGTSLASGTRIEGNVVHSQGHDQGAIYLDDCSRFVTVTHNLTYNAPTNIFPHLAQDPIDSTNNYTDPMTAPISIIDNAGIQADYQFIKG
ncbi:MAG: right-handed parallel beta-helix repeat-containing protein [Chloroflexota bacterium]